VEGADNKGNEKSGKGIKEGKGDGKEGAHNNGNKD
jgi:hypothetical protein